MPRMQKLFELSEYSDQSLSDPMDVQSNGISDNVQCYTNHHGYDELQLDSKVYV